MELTSQLAVRAGGSFRALQDRNLRLYLFGLIVSLSGTYMQQVAEGWLVYRLSNSAFTLGLVGFIVMLPLTPWVLVAGALADRLPRRLLLTATQLGQVVPPLLLALLVWTNRVEVWHVVVVDLLMAALSALDQPVRQALIVDAARPEHRDNAIALSGAGYSVARVIGPAIGGLLVAGFGEAACFALNGLSFLAVAFALWSMRIPARPPVPRRALHASVFEGLRYLAATPVVLVSIVLIVIVNLFVVPYQTLLPVFARDIFQAGPTGLGWLVTATGVGAIGGSLAVTNVRPGRRGRLVLGLGIGAALWMVLFTLSPALLVASAALVLVTGAVVALKVICYTLVQGEARDEFRGRVMSFVVLFDSGAPRLGGLGAGFLAARFSAAFSLQLFSAFCLGSLALLAVRVRSVASIR